MRDRLHLPLLILSIGALVTLIHEYIYARTASPDFEFGLISHGGLDMVGATLVSVLVALWYVTRPSE